MDYPVIDMTDVVVRRGGRQVLHIDALRVLPGELVAVVGPNGAGKSTLLQVINLLLPPAAGRFRLFGTAVPVADPLPLRRRCAMVFQDPLLLHDTVYNNVALPLRLRGYNDAAARDRIVAALELFRCRHLASRQAHRLSGGEAQRVCLARAMVHAPELLLLDEPFASLDTPTRAALLVDVQEAARRRGMTVLLVSHNYQDVLAFASRVFVMLDGGIIQQGTPEEVLRRPAHKAVAMLTGMDNMLPCSVQGGAVPRVVLPNGVAFVKTGVRPAASALCCLPGDAFTVLPDGASADGQVVLRGRVLQVIPGIGVCRVDLAAAEQRLIVRLPRSQAAQGLTVGAALSVAFSPEVAQVIYN